MEATKCEIILLIFCFLNIFDDLFIYIKKICIHTNHNYEIIAFGDAVYQVILFHCISFIRAQCKLSFRERALKVLCEY